jgi:enolase-phosphatase E1
MSVVLPRPRAILLDVEGTTTSIDFVHGALFPHARARMAAFVAARSADPAVRAALDEVSALEGRPLDDAAAVATLLQWMDQDRKATPLKALQGMIWREGYDSGALRGHLYDDAAEALRAWHARGISLYVYSSGSVLAQRLLFAHSDHGDLSPLFSGHFDTQSGGKREAASYSRIAGAIGVPAAEVLFASDVAAELEAARASGMRVVEVRRDGAPPSGAAGWVARLDEIAFDGPPARAP